MSIIKHKFFNTLYLYIVRKLEMQITKFWSSSIKFNKAMLWIYFTIMFYIKFFVNPNCKSKSIVKSPDVVNRLTKYIPKSFNNNSRTSSTLVDMSNNRMHVFKIEILVHRCICINILSWVMKESQWSSSSINRSALQYISMSSARVIEQHLHPLSTVN